MSDEQQNRAISWPILIVVWGYIDLRDNNDEDSNLELLQQRVVAKDAEWHDVTRESLAQFSHKARLANFCSSAGRNFFAAE